MIEVPAATGVIVPLTELTVAIVVVPAYKVQPALPLLVKVVVPFEQIACVPEIVPALSRAVTVTVLVANTSVQPPVPLTI